MKNWTVRQRIVFTSIVTLALMLFVGGVALYHLREIRRDMSVIEDDSLPGLYQISRVQAAMLADFALTEQLALQDDKAAIDATEARLKTSGAEVEAAFKAFEAGVLTERDREVMAAIRAVQAEYLSAQSEIRKAVTAQAYQEGHAIATRRLQPLFGKLQAAVQDGVNYDKGKADQSVQRIHNAIESANASVATGLGVAVLVSLVSGFFLVRAVTQPLSQLVSVVGVVSAGDFTQRVKLDRADEFGALGVGFDRMQDELTGLVTDVQKSGVLVSTSITEIAATAKEQQATANEVAATTTEIGATAKEISATARDLAQTVAHVSDGAQQAATLADSGRESLQRMDETMRRVSDAAGGINTRLTVLNDKAANIGSVVTTIAKVADQTNLLSLNAAIEAEKAGESGRGFAVVATEIRRLADQTAAATVDIEQLVKEIQSAVTAGVMGMDKFSEEVRRGVSDVEKVAGQLAQIIQHVQAITPRIGSVSEGMQAQSTGAEQISQALTQLGEAARQTAESLRQSNEIVRSLDEAARGLRSGIERFKVKN